MQMSRTLKILALASVLLLAKGSSLEAGQKKTSAMVVRAAAAAGPIDANGRQALIVSMAINKGWHLYANPLKWKEYDDMKTVLVVLANGVPVKSDIFYPAGKAYADPNAKATYMIYEDRVDIRAIVQRAPGDTGPLKVSATFNACTKTTCLPQGTLEIPVK